jgi:hypothetical protein
MNIWNLEKCLQDIHWAVGAVWGLYGSWGSLSERAQAGAGCLVGVLRGLGVGFVCAGAVGVSLPRFDNSPV